jgi:DHA1 family tetracycline resistance protein-like MFS transporter
MTNDPQDKLNFKRVLPIFVIVLIDLLGLTIIIPLLPLYAASFGTDPVTIGALQTAYPLMQLIGAPFLGGLSDRYGRKPVLLISQIGTFIGFVMLGFAGSIPILFLSRIIDGLSGANIVVAQAAITDSTNERTRAQGLGLIGAAFGLGFTVGPAIAGIALVATNNNYHVPAFLAAGFSLISVLLTAFWFHETLPEAQRGQKQNSQNNILKNLSRSLRIPLIGVLLVLMFTQQLVFGGLESLLALFSLSRLGLNAAGNAILFVFVGVILVMVQGKYIGPWSRRFGERRLIYVGLACLAAGLILTATTPPQTVPWYSQAEMEQELLGDNTRAANITIPLPDDSSSGWFGLGWLLVAMIPTSIGAGMLSPCINSLITKRVAKSDQGVALGVSSSLMSAANAITPILGGVIFQLIGTSAPFLLGGGVLIGLLLFAVRRIPPQADVTPLEQATAA